MHPLTSFFNPKSVALIGASTTPGKLGNDIMLNLKESFIGPIYPVNPHDAEVEGVPAFASVDVLPTIPELTVISVPGSLVPEVLEACGKKGCKNIIVISAGFKEVGGEGIVLEEKVDEIQKRYGMNLLGPNCLGYMSTALPVNASFSRNMPSKGNIAFFSQSGAMGVAVLDMARAQRLGVGFFISLGNMVDVDETDLLEYFCDEATVQVMLCYLEGIKDGQRFMKVAREVSKKKPILVLKAGKTEKGQKAVSSHTGSLAGSATSYSAGFRQAGVIEVDDVEDLFDFAEAFSYQPFPRGNRVGVVTNAGGPAILVTDFLPKYGLQLAELEESTKTRLMAKLPACASAQNPVDVIGDAKSDRYEHALQLVMEDPNVDSVILVLTPQKMTETQKTAVLAGEISRKYGKPIILCFMGEEEISKYTDTYEQYKLPLFSYPRQATKVAGKMWEYAKWAKEPTSQIEANVFDVEMYAHKIEKYRDTVRQPEVTEAEGRELLEALDFPVNAMKLVKNADSAVKFADNIGYPVALKVVSKEIVHKSDVGGVKINIADAKSLETAFATMQETIKANCPQAKVEGYLVGEMIKGQQIIIGMKRDPQFGPVVMFGMGGIYAEVFKDVSFRVAPFGKTSARKMIEETRMYKLLSGARGDTPCDIDAVVDLLLKTGDLARKYPEIQEIDFNPVMVFDEGKGCKIADVRILTR